ncbi:MAG TPA: hypothetical protein VND45_13505 [Thermoanaerobaculia bacterium]|nr:hypothetical protein [Thermoanaerobaculia bacterium]
MRQLRFSIALLLLMCCGGQRAAAAAPEALYGTWRGTSLCTPVRAACRDEVAVYHLAPSPKPHTVLMTMNKVVEGKEVGMGGTLEYDFDAATRTLTHEIATRDGSRALFRFTWSEKKLNGALSEVPGGAVIRNIKLEKR